MQNRDEMTVEGFRGGFLCNFSFRVSIFGGHQRWSRDDLEFIRSHQSSLEMTLRDFGEDLWTLEGFLLQVCRKNEGGPRRGQSSTH